jgi:hypothetical protein
MQDDRGSQYQPIAAPAGRDYDGTVSRLRLPLLLLILAVQIALVLPAAAHGDFFISNFNSTLIFTDRPNFYRAVADEPTAVFPTGLSGAPYGPLFYYPTAAWLWTLDALHLIDVDGWAGTNDAALRSLPTILALKLPNLAAYVIAAAVMAKALRGVRGRFAAELWLANPAVILFALMMGQNDGWTALASVAALYFGLRSLETTAPGARRTAGALAMLCLAAGAAIKLSPALLVPAFAWLIGRGYREKLLFALIAAGAFLLVIAPFLPTEYFRDYGLLGRQAGKEIDVPSWAFALLYGGYLALTVAAARRESGGEALLWSFVAFHALFFAVGGWGPQRSVLFIGALALAVPGRRWFLAPYALVTSFALLAALEHGNELAVGLFEPLTARALLVPSLVTSSRPEPAHSLLFWLSAAAWLAALALAWRPPKADGRVVAMAPLLLVAALPAYLAIAALRLPSGVDVTPYQQPARAQALQPGDSFSFYFISPQDELRSITFWVESGDGRASVTTSDAEGSTLSSEPARAMAPGANRITLPRIERAAGRGYVVSIVPTAPLSVRMVSPPPGLALASAELNGTPVPGTAWFSAHYETSWGRLFSHTLGRLGHAWRTLVVSLALSVGAFAGCCALLRNERPATGQ